MLHDRYAIKVEQAVRFSSANSRNADEKGAGGFWDLAGLMASEIGTFSQDEQQEVLYNVFHQLVGAVRQTVGNRPGC